MGIDVRTPNDGGIKSSSLDPLETSENLRPADTRAQREFHKKWELDRRHILDALFSAHDTALTTRAVRMADCCSFPSVGLKSDGKPCLLLHRCKDRMCPRCQQQRSIVLSARVAAHVKTMNAPRFVTLTLKHRNASLSEEYKRLFAGFKELRKSKFWKRNVKGGVFGVEVKRNPQTERWHCHVHLIVDGSYMPQSQLSEEWKKATKDSEVVDIRAVPDREKTAHYIAKYIMKKDEIRDWNFRAVREFATALKGKRLVHTFGTLHGQNVDPAKDPAEPTLESPLCSLHRLNNWAERGHAEAQHAREVLSNLGNHWRAGLGLLPMPPVHAWIIPSPEELKAAVETCEKIGNADAFPEAPTFEENPNPDDEPPTQAMLFAAQIEEIQSAHVGGL